MALYFDIKTQQKKLSAYQQHFQPLFAIEEQHVYAAQSNREWIKTADQEVEQKAQVNDYGQHEKRTVNDFSLLRHSLKLAVQRLQEQLQKLSNSEATCQKSSWLAYYTKVFLIACWNFFMPFFGSKPWKPAFSVFEQHQVHQQKTLQQYEQLSLDCMSVAEDLFMTQLQLGAELSQSQAVQDDELEETLDFLVKVLPHGPFRHFSHGMRALFKLKKLDATAYLETGLPAGSKKAKRFNAVVEQEFQRFQQAIKQQNPLSLELKQQQDYCHVLHEIFCQKKEVLRAESQLMSYESLTRSFAICDELKKTGYCPAVYQLTQLAQQLRKIKVHEERSDATMLYADYEDYATLEGKFDLYMQACGFDQRQQAMCATSLQYNLAAAALGELLWHYKKYRLQVLQSTQKNGSVAVEELAPYFPGFEQTFSSWIAKNALTVEWQAYDTDIEVQEQLKLIQANSANVSPITVCYSRATQQGFYCVLDEGDQKQIRKIECEDTLSLLRQAAHQGTCSSPEAQESLKKRITTYLCTLNLSVCTQQFKWANELFLCVLKTHNVQARHWKNQCAAVHEVIAHAAVAINGEEATREEFESVGMNADRKEKELVSLITQEEDEGFFEVNLDSYYNSPRSCNTFVVCSQEAQDPEFLFGCYQRARTKSMVGLSHMSAGQRQSMVKKASPSALTPVGGRQKKQPVPAQGSVSRGQQAGILRENSEEKPIETASFVGQK